MAAEEPGSSISWHPSPRHLLPPRRALLLTAPAPAASPLAAPPPRDAVPARSLELDGLRGVAIGLVLLCHFLVRMPFGAALRDRLPGVGAVLAMSWVGVDLFFVISGFLIGGILLDHHGSASLRQTFYARRACRIVPLYALLLLLAFAPLGRAAAPAAGSEVPLAAYLLFAQNLWTANGAQPVLWLGPAWSIAIEEQFYLLAALLVPMLSRRALTLGLLGCVALSPCLRLLALLGVLPQSPWDFTLFRLDAPAVGVLGALLVRHAEARAFARRLLARLRRALPLLLAGAVALSQLSRVEGDRVLPSVGLSYLALCALSALLVALHGGQSITARATRSPWLVYLGRRSYFLYLFHMPALSIALRADLALDGWARVLLALAVLLPLAELSWRVVESPVLALGRRLRY